MDRSLYHTKAWLIWLVTGLIMSLTSTNPLYLALLAVVMAINFDLLGRRSILAANWRPLVRFTLLLSLAPALFNPLFVHEGETVLFNLPTWRWFVEPEGRIALLTLGGPVTLEALIYGITRGLSLMNIILTFATFNVLANTSHLLRSLPKPMYQMGVVTSIAVSFVPQMTLALQDIREAQMVRGHRFRGVRDLLPLFMPLLTTGLERAVQLAESMESRGFSRQDEISPAQENTYKALIALALFILIAAAVLLGFTGGMRAIGWSLVVLAVILIWRVFHSMGLRVQRSRYLNELWHSRDTRLVLITLTALVIFLVFCQLPSGFTGYYPYPQVHWPGFNPFVGGAIAALIGPVVLAGQKSGKGKI